MNSSIPPDRAHFYKQALHALAQPPPSIICAYKNPFTYESSCAHYDFLMQFQVSMPKLQVTVRTPKTPPSTPHAHPHSTHVHLATWRVTPHVLHAQYMRTSSFGAVVAHLSLPPRAHKPNASTHLLPPSSTCRSVPLPSRAARKPTPCPLQPLVRATLSSPCARS